MENRIALFIDGPNLYATAKTLGFDVDYKRLLKEFQGCAALLRAFYYTAIIEDQEHSSVRALIDWLDYNGYTVVTKATKEFIDASGRRKVKSNMHIELAVDAMEIAEHVDQMVLFSVDGDFRSLVEAVQGRGVCVTVVSTISSQPPMIADELRRQADVFIDLMELQSKIGRDSSERPAPREPVESLPGSLRRQGYRMWKFASLLRCLAWVCTSNTATSSRIGRRTNRNRSANGECKRSNRPQHKHRIRLAFFHMQFPCLRR